uniref:Chromo domain-containing protein n=1 Tax=Caenorhabditis tropicalis TaxID=1561998 RepID=A0A1I7TN93_9PELO
MVKANGKSSQRKQQSDFYDVEKIVGSRRNRTEYLVKWKGYGDNDNTWVKKSHLNCRELVNKFEEEEAARIIREIEESNNGVQEQEVVEIAEEVVEDSEQEEPQEEVVVNERRGRAVQEVPVVQPAQAVNQAQDNDDEEHYEVEKIVSSRKNGTEFLVKWKGYGPEANTWSKKSDLNCPLLIKKFEKEQAKAKTAKKSVKVSKPEEKEYAVEKILASRKNGAEYLVKWKGYSSSDNSWVKKADLHCSDKIKQFHKSQKK